MTGHIRNRVNEGNINRLSLLLVLVLFLPKQDVLACTAFCLHEEGGLVATKNLDWYLDDGLVYINKRGVSKSAMMIDQSEKAARWVSKYASVTFNQYGREMPYGGMNEAGLVVEVLMLPGTQYPVPDDRPALLLLSWVQFQLDNFRTVSQVIESDRQIRISPSLPIPLHFFICDQSGCSAVIEFLSAERVCHTEDTLPLPLITNNTYDDSLGFLKEHKSFGGTRQIAHGSRESLDRFVIAAERLKAYGSNGARSIVDYAFDTLGAVRQGPATKWSIVYDIKNLDIHYRTQRRPETKTVRLRDFDLSYESPVQMINVNTAHTGLLNTHFVDYDPDLNAWMAYYSVRRTVELKDLPDAFFDAFAHYPDTMVTE